MEHARPRVFTSETEARKVFPGAVFSKPEQGSTMARSATNLTSQLFVSLYHNWYLEDAITLREGLPALDLINGDATDILGGWRRHEVEFQAGAFKSGLGARITATWQGGTDIRGLDSSAGDLRFGSLATINLNLFANLAEHFGGSDAPGWLKGARTTIGVTNLFNTRPQVRDRAGATPLSYQPAYLGPLRRVLSFGLRKAFQRGGARSRRRSSVNC